MDWTALIDTVTKQFGELIPSVVLALIVLAVGWMLAVIVRGLLRRGLRALGVNRRVQSSTGSSLDIENGTARGAFYLVMVLALVAFFNALNLSLVSRPLGSLVEQVLGYIPNLVAGGVLILVAWILATVVRLLVTRALAATTIDDKLSQEAGMRPMSESVGHVLYGLVLLLFLPAVLGVLGLEGLLLPVQGMIDQVLAKLPDLLAGGLLIAGGWFVAKILRDLVQNLAAAGGADRLGARVGLSGNLPLSRLIGLVLFVLVFLNALIAGLDAMGIEAIARPATTMLQTMMSAVPAVFAAILILSLAWFVARLAGELATQFLGGVGIDGWPEKLGLKGPAGDWAPSKLVGRLIVFFTMLFAATEAADQLGFTQVSGFVATFIGFGGQVLLGVVVILVGLWIAHLAHAAVLRLGRSNAPLVAGLVRIVIVGLVLAMGLSAMNIDDEIVKWAFILTLGSAAVAAALSFGLGGREAAGRQMEYWFSKFRNEG